MAFNKRDNELNMEQVAAFLKDAVTKVETNPEFYEELKKVFKKNVPLTRRSYVAAYLLKCASGAIFRFNPNRPARDDRNNRRDRDDRRNSRYEDRSNRSENGESETKERYQRVEIAPENAATVFVNIGRNRRVYPRDLLGLFINEAGLERDRIGNIKVFANYSFVELFKEDEAKAISALNGYNYRGRALAVSHSIKKEDEEVETTVAAPEDYINEERVPDVENTSAPIADSFTTSNADTVAQQAAFAKEMEKAPVELTDEEILAMRAPRSSSTADIQ